jgi:hypothetical protein
MFWIIVAIVGMVELDKQKKKEKENKNLFKTIKGITVYGDKVDKLTIQEARAIHKLQKLVNEWPKTLWLFSVPGSLCVMQKKDGEQATKFRDENIDPDYFVCSIDIENDGGDW